MAGIHDLQKQVQAGWQNGDDAARGKIMKDVQESVDPSRFKDELATRMYIDPQLVLDARLNDFRSERVVGKAQEAKRRIQYLFNPNFINLMHNNIPVDWQHLRPIDADTLSQVLGNLDDSQGLRHLKDIVSRAWDAQDYQNALSCCYARYGQAFTKALKAQGYQGKSVIIHRLKQSGDTHGLLHEIEQDVASLWQLNGSGVHGMSKRDLFAILEDIDKTATR